MKKYKLKQFFKRIGASLVLGLMLSLTALPVAHALDIDIDMSPIEDAICEGLGDGIFTCDDGSESSFTNFEGEFAPPDGEGYAEGITQTSSAREFIVNVTNFVLGFLGLAAVVVVIYGGILYVTAAGEQERADKGKKSVMYAMIGIVIILASYALVNTVIQSAATGSDREGTSGLYSSNDVNSESLRSFQVEQMSANLEDLTGEYMDAYTSFVNTMAVLEAMINVDLYHDEGLTEMEDGFELIEGEAESLSETADACNDALQLIRRYVSFGFIEKVMRFVNHSEWLQADVSQAQAQAQAADPADPVDPDPYGIGSDVVTHMNAISSAAYNDFTNSLAEITAEVNTLHESFTDLHQINLLFNEVKPLLGEYQGGSYSPTTIGSTNATGSVTIYGGPPGGSGQVSDIVEILNQIYLLVQDLEFTTAVISANTDTANSPVTVTFDALDSYDPSELTIIDDNYQWDLSGDGFNGGLDDKTGPNVSYTYEDPGTYRVALMIKSSDDNIASGISYLSIKVNPPSSIINLTGQSQLGGVSATDITELTSWTVTGEQARAGIIFDASATTDGDGNFDTIINYAYNFGDSETTSGESPTATHYYESEGTYHFELEVTDQNGVTDRKILDLVISSPAASLTSETTEGQIGDVFVFSAEESITDDGNIIAYDWIITKDGETIYDPDETSASPESTLTYSFDSPGEYLVTVIVSDSKGAVDDAFLTVTIASTEPVALFKHEIPDSTKPGRVHFDGGNSYDPDQGDTLTYEWSIEGVEGTDFAFAESTDATFEEPIVDFYKTGNFDVTLTAYDQYEGDLQQQGSYTKDITIDSVLDINVTIDGTSITFLEGGQATIDLNLESTQGVSYEVNWGDGGSLETIPVTTVGIAEKVQHNYLAAGSYPISIKVYDDSGSSNEMIRNAYIGNGEEPIPVISVFVDNVESADSNNVSGNRMSSFRFDASGSVDMDGSSLNTSSSFSWDFGDGTSPAKGERLTHTYDEIGTFEVTLTVISALDQSVSAQSTTTVNVEDNPPRIYGLTVTPQADELTTPLTVRVKVDAEDEDGEISSYKFWYYDVDNSSVALDPQITTSDEVYLTVNTNGETSEVKTYGFAVEVTDNENNVITSEDELIESQIPTLEVENGLNQSPVADFTVNKTNILINEEVSFTSSAYDEDGEIVSYIWDVDGDGFYNDAVHDEPTYVYTYEYSAPDGVEVRLKVTDDSGATATSEPVRIYVDTLTEKPEAAFLYTVNPSGENPLEIEFQNNSTADVDNGASLVAFEWDFNTSEDSNGNGVKDDDQDSTDENPVHAYDDFGTYRVKLTITDNEGNIDEVINSVQVVEIEEPFAYIGYEVNDLTVNFVSDSTVGEGATIETFEWEFGDGSFSEEVDPSHTYADYGSYTVKLTVTDDFGRSHTAQGKLELEAPVLDDLSIQLYTSPETSQAGAGSVGTIYVTEDNKWVEFLFSAEGVYGTPTFCIDQDLDYDSPPYNNNPADDCDFSSNSVQNIHSIEFQPEWEPIQVEISVTDSGTEQFDALRKDSVKLNVRFQEPEWEGQASASALPVTTAEALYIFVTAMLFTILGARIYTRSEETFEN